MDATQNREQSLRWVITPMPYASNQLIQIIGGQALSGVSVITYAADPLTPDRTYDPYVDTTYPNGMGYGWIYDRRGMQQAKVLIRHSYAGYTDPFMAGRVVLTPGTVKLTAADATVMYAYLISRG